MVTCGWNDAPPYDFTDVAARRGRTRCAPSTPRTTRAERGRPRQRPASGGAAPLAGGRAQPAPRRQLRGAGRAGRRADGRPSVGRPARAGQSAGAAGRGGRAGARAGRPAGHHHPAAPRGGARRGARQAVRGVRAADPGRRAAGLAPLPRHRLVGRALRLLRRGRPRASGRSRRSPGTCWPPGSAAGAGSAPPTAISSRPRKSCASASRGSRRSWAAPGRGLVQAADRSLGPPPHEYAYGWCCAEAPHILSG